MVLLAGGSVFAQSRLSIGVGIGGYAPGYYPGYPSVQAVVPPCPGPDYSWVDGYWSPYGGRNTWVAGYWARPAFVGGYRSGYRGGYVAAPRYAQPFHGNAYRQGSVSRGFDRGGHDRGRQYGPSNQNGFRGR